MTVDSSENSGEFIRPASVVWYERLAWVVVVLSAPSAVADRATLVR